MHVYTDGSVLLTHGGMEMGQGLHTKMVQVRECAKCLNSFGFTLFNFPLQVCARCLSVPVEKVFISETSTSTVANASATVASMSSDLWGMAVKVQQC